MQEKAKRTVTDETVLDCIKDAIAEKEPVPFRNWKAHKFECNIQQVKRREFDVLYYGLFFSDHIKIFRINRSEIKTRTEGGYIGYSDKQHKGNEGEGQFHITEKNLQVHLNKYFHKTLTYDQLYRLLVATI